VHIAEFDGWDCAIPIVHLGKCRFGGIFTHTAVERLVNF
jgi:hypothetical protein